MGESIILLVVAAIAAAAPTKVSASDRGELPDCVDEVAQIYQIPVALLRAVRVVEGGRRGAVVGPNRNGTHDLGAMQINSAWLPTLGAYGIDREDVLGNDCTNLAVGAWVLRQSVDKYGTWEDAISAYNTGRPLPAGRRYYAKVLSHWRRFADQGSGG